MAVPAACLSRAGWLAVSVTGYGEDGSRRCSARASRALLVVESGEVPDLADVPEGYPEPEDLLSQLLSAAEAAEGAAGAVDAANAAAAAASEAAGRAEAAASQAMSEADVKAYMDERIGAVENGSY